MVARFVFLFAGVLIGISIGMFIAGNIEDALFWIKLCAFFVLVTAISYQAVNRV